MHCFFQAGQQGIYDVTGHGKQRDVDDKTGSTHQTLQPNTLTHTYKSDKRGAQTKSFLGLFPGLVSEHEDPTVTKKVKQNKQKKKRDF